MFNLYFLLVCRVEFDSFEEKIVIVFAYTPVIGGGAIIYCNHRVFFIDGRTILIITTK